MTFSPIAFKLAVTYMPLFWVSSKFLANPAAYNEFISLCKVLSYLNL
jgi:hypothetical protein